MRLFKGKSRSLFGSCALLVFWKDESYTQNADHPPIPSPSALIFVLLRGNTPELAVLGM